MRGDEVDPEVEEELLERYGESRKCKGCGEDKPFSAYNVCRWDGNTYLAGECIPCHRDKERKRERELRDRSDDEIPTPDKKECTGCGEVKPSSEFYAQRDNPDGLTYRCKRCYDARRGRTRSWEEYNRDRRIESGPNHSTRAGIRRLARVEAWLRERRRERRVGRVCSKCGETKPRSEFYDNPSGVGDKDAACKACRRSAYRERYRENTEEERRRVRAYKHANPDVVAAQHERRNDRWKRARDQADGTVTREAIARLLDRAKRCYWCKGRFRSESEKTIDHVIPLAENGPHSLRNLCVACEDCNFSKGAKMPNEWAPGDQVALAL